MKICIINTLYPPNIVGGAEKSVGLLASAYAAQGHSVVALSLHDSTETKSEDVNGVHAYYLPLDNIYWPFTKNAKPSLLKRLLWHINDIWNWKAAAKVGQILDSEKPDVLHTNNLTGFSVAVWWEAKKRNIRIVHTLRDYSLLCVRGTLFHNGVVCEKRCAECWLLSTPKNAASVMVDRVVGNSDFTLREHIKRGYFKTSDQDVIFNIVDVEPIAMKPLQKNADGEVVFGFLGRLEDQKGTQVLLRACASLPSKGWRLLVAGSGRDAYVKALQALYQHLPITWLGFVAAEKLFQDIGLLIVPSVWPEPLSRTVIEAAAAGIPVLVSDAGGQSELLAQGIPGVLYPALDEKKLATHLDDILNEKGPFFDGSMAQLEVKEWARHFKADEVTAKNLAGYKAADV